MRCTHGLLAAAVAFVIAGTFVHAQTKLQPGKYELTMEISRDGKTKPVMKMETCVTPQDVANMARLLTQEIPDEDCKVSNLKTQADRMTFSISCKNDGVAYDSTAELRFAADSYVGFVTTTTDGEVFTTKMTGKRIGVCDKP